MFTLCRHEILVEDKAEIISASMGIGPRGDKGAWSFFAVIIQFRFVATALHKLGAVMVPAAFALKENVFGYRLNFGEIKASSSARL